jgi:hypothetical protein
LIEENIFVTRTPCTKSCVTRIASSLVAEGHEPLIITGTHGSSGGQFVGNNPVDGFLAPEFAEEDAQNVGAQIL